MAPIFERDINPYETPLMPAPIGELRAWPNRIPQPPAPQGTQQTDPRAGDYRESLVGQEGLDARYIAAFGPTDDAISRIKMIRITVTLDDPNNRLADGQQYQYVVALP